MQRFGGLPLWAYRRPDDTLIFRKYSVFQLPTNYKQFFCGRSASFALPQYKTVSTSSVPNPVFLAIFYYPKPVFFNYQTRVFKKNWDFCCIQILVILITLKLQIGACNAQISTFELSIIIVRQWVRVLLGDHRTFVVGRFIFS